MKKAFLLILAVLTCQPLVIIAKEHLIIEGAGPSAVVTELFFDELSKTADAKAYTFEIPQHSIKHKGGIRFSDTHLFGRTGRRMNDADRGKNKHEILIARVPITFVIGDGVQIDSITIGTLADIYNRRITNWKQLGGPDKTIKLVGREETESAYSTLKHDFDFFNHIKFDKILQSDDEVIDYIASQQGKYAISFGARSNFNYQYLLDVYGFSSGVSVGLVYDEKNASHPLIEHVKRFASTPEWRNTLQFSGYLPPK